MTPSTNASFASINLLLEMLNGSFGIFAIFAVFFLAIHLHDMGVQRHMSWRGWVSELPVGLQIAVGFLFIAIGEMITRTSVWWWRVTTGGATVSLWDYFAPLGIGSAFCCAGFLCVIRVSSRARTGSHWPWVLATVFVILFNMFTLSTRLIVPSFSYVPSHP